jgi:hypothetical protein
LGTTRARHIQEGEAEEEEGEAEAEAEETNPYKPYPKGIGQAKRWLDDKRVQRTRHLTPNLRCT